MTADPPGDPGATRTALDREIDLRDGGRERIRELHTVTVALARSLTVEDVLDAIVDLGAAAADAAATIVALVGPASGELEVRRANGFGAEDRATEQAVVGHPDSPMVDALRLRRPMAVPSLEGVETEPLATITRLGHRSMCAIPITAVDEVVGVVAFAYRAPRSFVEDDLEVLDAIARHCGAALERVRLLRSERAARDDAERARREADRLRVEAERARDRLAFLAAVGRSVLGTLEPAEVMQRVLDLAVPRIADAGLGYLPDAGGLRRVAIAHQDPDALELGRQYVLGTTTSIDANGAAARCFRSGEIHVERDVDRRDLAGAPEYVRATVQDYGLRCWLCVPVHAGSEILGVLALGFNDPDHLAGDEEISLAVEVAGRTASGLMNASKFERERDVALILQRSVLPTELPVVPGLELATRYLPAQAGIQVGGDWYDVFDLPGSRIGFTIGDVSGHGLEAAAMMGRLRNAARAYAVEGHSPAEVVRLVNLLLACMPDEEFASMVCATVDTTSGSVTWASAGHPPMLHVTAGGTEVLAEPHGILLAAEPAMPCPEGSLVLGPGQSLVLYTDGLVERHDEPLDASIRSLAERLAPLHRRRAEALADAALEPLVRRAPLRDDVCLLVVRRVSPP